MASFDIVSEVDLQEVDNAVNQSKKEISTRFDFRGGQSDIVLDRQQKVIRVVADDELKLRSIHQILEQKLAKRGIDLRSLEYNPPSNTSQNALKQEIKIRQGIDRDQARKIVQLVKNTKLKVQAQIQDDQVRVTGKKIDDLQAVIATLKQSDLGLALQFVNMRS